MKNSPPLLKAFLFVSLGAFMMNSAWAQQQTLGVDRPYDPGNFAPQDGTDSDVPGSFFDLVADTDLEVTAISAYSYANYSGEPGAQYTFQIWYKDGSYVGSEETEADWTLLDTISGTDVDDATMEQLVLSTPFLLNAGETTGFAIMATQGGYQWYDRCGREDTYVEGDLTLNIIGIRGIDDGFDSSDQCRSFAGLIHFGEPSAAPRSIPSLSGTGLVLLSLLLGMMGLFLGRKTV